MKKLRYVTDRRLILPVGSIICCGGYQFKRSDLEQFLVKFMGKIFSGVA